MYLIICFFMNWSKPHITKIPEALGAIVDSRLEMGENNTAKVYSSSRNKFYTIIYNPVDNSIMSNDNASYWKGSLGYPAIAYLMKIGEIPFDAELAQLFSGIAWKDINQQFKNDFDKTWEFLLAGLSEKGYDRTLIEQQVQSVQNCIVAREWKMNGEKTVPPNGY